MMGRTPRHLALLLGLLALLAAPLAASAPCCAAGGGAPCCAAPTAGACCVAPSAMPTAAVPAAAPSGTAVALPGAPALEPPAPAPLRVRTASGPPPTRLESAGDLDRLALPPPAPAA